MDGVGSGEVRQRGFGQRAVGHDHEIVCIAEQVRRPPVCLDHLASYSSLDLYPIPDGIWATKIQRDPRKDIVQRALQR